MKKLLGLSALFLLGSIFVSCTDYGDKVEKDKNEVYYKDGATESEASELLDYLVENGFFTPGQDNSAQLTKNDDTYIVKLVVKESYRSNEEFITSATILGEMLAGALYPDSKVELHLCDEHFETVKNIKIDAETSNKVIDRDENQVIYDSNIDESMAEAVFSYCRKQEYFTAGNANTVRIRNEDGQIEMDCMVKEGIWEDESFINRFKAFAQGLNENCFDSSLASLNLCDRKFDVKKRIEP